MSNTIQLLETIGKNADLRHASSEHLARALAELDASESLKRAAASRDGNHLARELSFSHLQIPNNINQYCPDEEFEPEPGREDQDLPRDDDDGE